MKIIHSYTGLIISLCVLSLFNTSVADEKIENTPDIRSAVGLNAGWVIGNGLIYRQYMGKQFFQVTFAGLIDKQEEQEYLNLSASYARYLNQFNFTTPIGLKWVIGAEGVYDVDNGTTDNQINIGSGIGVDVGNVKRPGITVSADLIYTASFIGIKTPTFNALDLRPSLGILYNF